ncbi:hypothetical protein GQ44DRAFT_771281 [Phaeosphaeriaceae sp. PMI808]|nr:hypothetical protein GQ44DRAFT_771281 [Phaeosphaeriaceae sp. PMI808]
METADDSLRYNKCGLTFPKRHLVDTHRKRHDRPFKCTDNQCDRAFQYKKDLERHRHAKHSETVRGIALLYYSHPGCKYSFERGTGSPNSSVAGEMVVIQVAAVGSEPTMISRRGLSGLTANKIRSDAVTIGVSAYAGALHQIRRGKTVRFATGRALARSGRPLVHGALAYPSHLIGFT